MLPNADRKPGILITPLDSMAPDLDTPKPSYNWSKVTPDIRVPQFDTKSTEMLRVVQINQI